jgi:hypothetical protein
VGSNPDVVIEFFNLPNHSSRTMALKVDVNLRPKRSRPVCLGVRRPSGTRDKFFFLLEISFRQFYVIL